MGIEPRFFGCTDCSLVTIMTELSRLQIIIRYLFACSLKTVAVNYRHCKHKKTMTKKKTRPKPVAKAIIIILRNNDDSKNTKQIKAFSDDINVALD